MELAAAGSRNKEPAQLIWLWSESSRNCCVMYILTSILSS